MHDPLQLADKPAARAVQLDRSAPHPEVVNSCSRIVSSQYGDSVEVRVQLLAHALYFAYMHLLETFTHE